MATPKEQAEATLRRLEGELNAARYVLDGHLKTEKEDRERGYDKVGPARFGCPERRARCRYRPSRSQAA